jgi:hypothetical protein
MGWWSNLWRYGFTAEQQRLARAAENYARAIAAYQEELRRLTPDDAQHRAARLLAAPSRFRTYPWTGAPTANLARLTPHQQSILAQARRIEGLKGEPYLDTAELGPYEWDASLTRLGLDSEHAYILIRLGEETVYVVDETEALDPTGAQQFQALSHWVLWLDRSGGLLSTATELETRSDVDPE